MNGLLLGDHVGSIYEGSDKIRGYSLPLFSPASHITDDSILAAAICSELLKDSDNFERALVDWYQKYPYEEYSFSFFKWLEQDIGDSSGNGSATRSIPAGYVAQSENEAIHLAQKISKITHSHHEGMCGAESVAWVIFKLRHGAGFEEIKYQCYENWGYYLDYDLEFERKDRRGVFTTSAWDTVPISLFIGLKSTSVEDALRKCLWLGGDCDSQAAIACSVASLIHGKISNNMMQKVYSANVRKFNDVLLIFSQFNQNFCA
ncbi:ADP-ribosylglycohydrolase family protein [Shewanella polaris]|uniref:ADP-ribosylglycohydrolase family protein n=1 Tax=Shewanella polaris TaxID=2588449 RepID=UPI00142EABDC|nr:ADP-ribosylglycohydrolase family protein [Shewanella polaris]